MNPQLRNNIIYETYKLFITKGIKKTSFNDVAKAVDKSKGAVLYYFPTKEILAITVIETYFYTASQIPPKLREPKKIKFNIFLKIYQNPIERVIFNFPFCVNSNKLIAYMQFVSSANEFVEDFATKYREMLAHEYLFLKDIVQEAIENGEVTINDTQEYCEHFFNSSVGNTFSSYFMPFSQQ